jgi:hypothetical protein
VTSLVWLAKVLASMICSPHEASIGFSRIDARGSYCRFDPNQLFNASNADF